MMNCKKMFFILTAGSLALGLSSSVYAKCEKKDAEAIVAKTCEIYKSKGKEEAYKFSSTERFCGNNYVWFETVDTSKPAGQGAVFLTYHPVSPGLVGIDLGQHKNLEVKTLFLKLDKTLRDAQADGKGHWVNYDWAKPGEEKLTPKNSYMAICAGNEGAGAGFWLDQ